MRIARTKLTRTTAYLHQITICPKDIEWSPIPASRLYAKPLKAVAGKGRNISVMQPGE